jgi:hypothetical protein
MNDIRYNRSNLRQSPHRRVITIALVIAGLGMVGFFGIRAYRAYDRFQHDVPATGLRDVEAIRGWMTLSYIARAYGVPEDALFEALTLPKAGNARLSVKQLVAKYDRDPQATRQTIQKVLLRELRGVAPGGGAP